MPVQSVNRTNHSFSSATIRRVVAECLMMIEEQRARNAVRRTLGNVSDRQLRDAGIIRNDIDAAFKHPLADSSASELSASARRRIGNW